MINLDKDEKLILEVRKHSFIFFVHSALSILFAVLPLLGLSIFHAVHTTPLTAEVFWLEAFGYSLWLLVVWVVFFVYWTDYYLDVWYVTDRKIYDVLQDGLFHRQVSILHLENIQDITVSTHGIIATLLGFGDLHVQTAGETSTDFTIISAKDPNMVKDVISDLHQKRRRI